MDESYLEKTGQLRMNPALTKETLRLYLRYSDDSSIKVLVSSAASFRFDRHWHQCFIFYQFLTSWACLAPRQLNYEFSYLQRFTSLRFLRWKSSKKRGRRYLITSTWQGIKLTTSQFSRLVPGSLTALLELLHFVLFKLPERNKVLGMVDHFINDNYGIITLGAGPKVSKPSPRT